MARALLSVADKTGIVTLGRGLHALGLELVSTGGTAQALRDADIPVTEVADATGFPEILDGRVKTLHPVIHGGILARRELPEDLKTMSQHEIAPIDVVVCNLYPFAAARAAGADDARLLEEIDIGGVTLLRAAAKNHRDVLVLVESADYQPVLDALRQHRDDLSLRRRLALKAFRHTAAYDSAIAAWLETKTMEARWPERKLLGLSRLAPLRYGENPHQAAAFYHAEGPLEGLAAARLLHGKELSFNNLADVHTAVGLAAEFPDGPCAVAVKHQNPCGVALAPSLAEAYERAHNADRISIFGGIVALNRPVDAETAEQMRQIFLEVIVAPDFSEEARRILGNKRDLRLLALPTPWPPAPPLELRGVWGGYLMQEGDRLIDEPGAWQVASQAVPTTEERAEALFAWRVVKHVKSNAIVISKGGVTLGIGAGQMNRVDAARQALARAGAAARGAILASDAFLPFGDVAQEAAAAGIRLIVQPGGSIRDHESIEAADQSQMVMLMTGVRHFLH